AFGSTALGQFLATFRRSGPGTSKKALMEGVVAQAYISPDSPLRQAAASNLYAHITEMIQQCRSKSIPVIVCTLASNERGLAPIGKCDLSGLTPDERSRLTMLLNRGSSEIALDVGKAVDDFESALRIDPHHARLHYLLGRALEAQGDESTATEHFRRAIDLDPMPWRAPSSSMDAVRRAAADGGAVLCDVQQAFRDASPTGAVGWELMDDHVHPTLKGQWLVAKSILSTLTSFDGKLHVSRSDLDSLSGFRAYARRLGDNFYDRFGVIESMCRLFDISFMKASNPDASRRIASRREALLAEMSSILREQVRKWADPTTHSGFKIPLSGMVARIKMRQGLLGEAEALFRAARRHVPGYTGPYFEHTCFALACRQQTAGTLTESDRQLARDTIDRIALFLQFAKDSSGQPERFMGRLYQILGDHRAAIPRLLTAANKLTGDNRTKAELALVASYVQTGDTKAARTVLENGVQRGGAGAPLYRQLLSTLPSN
ncbi:MAG: tetratricopeptide repeat protein, partial [Phycisphaerae bacterium]